MTREEVSVLLSKLQGTPRLMASLLYGAGLRLLECASLRVKDVDFGAGQLVIRRAKGSKDRMTLLPRVLVEPLRVHLKDAQRLHETDLANGAGYVELPHSPHVTRFDGLGLSEPSVVPP